jgi:hypothetical protein
MSRTRRQRRRTATARPWRPLCWVAPLVRTVHGSVPVWTVDVGCRFSEPLRQTPSLYCCIANFARAARIANFARARRAGKTLRTLPARAARAKFLYYKKMSGRRKTWQHTASSRCRSA